MNILKTPKKLFSKVPYAIQFIKPSNVFLQKRLLELSLSEIGIQTKGLPISIDHENGTAKVGSVDVGLVYPRRFFTCARILQKKIRHFEYYFNGAMPANGGRREMLEKYLSRNDSKILESYHGRKNSNKGRFNESYFSDLGNSKFALCPHQADWPGPRETMWTYRFVEACMAGSIPILFRATPLGSKFIDGFHFFWDDTPCVYQHDLAMENQRLAIERFTLGNSEIFKILQTLQTKNQS